MAAFDQIKLLCLKKILTMESVKVSSSPNSPLLFAIVFWGETNRSSFSAEWMFLKISQVSQCWSLFLIKLQAWKSVSLLKRDSNTVVFLWNLKTFYRVLIPIETDSGPVSLKNCPLLVLSRTSICWRLE